MMRKIVLLPEEQIPVALVELKLVMKEENNHKMFIRYQAISNTWFPKGQQKIIPTYVGSNLISNHYIYILPYLVCYNVISFQVIGGVNDD